MLKVSLTHHKAMLLRRCAAIDLTLNVVVVAVQEKTQIYQWLFFLVKIKLE